MIDAPQITQTVSQLTANLHLTVPRAEIRNVMGPGLSEVRAAIAAQGVAAAGPWFTHHLKMDPGIFDLRSVCRSRHRLLRVDALSCAAGPRRRWRERCTTVRTRVLVVRGASSIDGLQQ